MGKNKHGWYLILTVTLVSVSLLGYLLQIYIFHDRHNTVFYFFQDISFVPINVLLVTVIIDRLLQKKEKESLIKKLNMIVGLFFTEIGVPLMSDINRNAVLPEILAGKLHITGAWTDKKFQSTIYEFRNMKYEFDPDRGFLEELKNSLKGRRELLLALMENPNLLEHDSFTDMLLAVFHLGDELSRREDLNTLPSTDIEHLKIDINRAYSLLITEWLFYMRHLRKAYPYLFSIEMRKNPFDESATIIVA